MDVLNVEGDVNNNECCLLKEDWLAFHMLLTVYIK